MSDAPDIVSHRVALSSNSNVWCSRYCISSCCSLLQQQCLMLQILYLIVLLSPTTAMSDAPDIVSHRVALSYNSNVWCSRYCISSCCSLLQQQCLMLQILYLIVLLSPTTAMRDAPDIVSHRVALSSNSNVWCSRYCISSCCSLLQQQCLMLQILYLIVLLSPPTAMSDAPDIVSHRVALSSNSNVWCSRYCISSCCSLLQQQCLMLQILYLIVLLSPPTAMSDAPDIVSHRVALSYNSNVWCSRYCISSCCSLLQQQCLMLQILYLIVLLSPTTAMSDAPDIVSHRVALSSNSNVWCSRYCISSCCSLLQQQCLMLQILYLIVLLSPPTMSDAPDIVSHRVALSYNSNVWCSRYCISSCCSLLQQQCLMLHILYLTVLLSPPTAMSDAPDIVSHRVALSYNSNVWCSRYCISSCCSLLQQQCVMLQILYLIVLLSPPTAMSDAPDIVSHRVALSSNSNVWCSRYCISSCCSLLQQQCLMLHILYLIVLLSPTTAMSDAPDIVSHRVALSYNSNVWCSRYCISSCCSLLQQQCLMLQILYLIVLLSPTTAMRDAPDIVSHRVALSLSSNSNVWCSRYCISSCCSLLQQQCLMLQILYLIVLLSPPTAMSDAPDIVSHRVALSYNSNVWCSRYCISSCCSLLQQQCLMLQILYLIVLLSPTTAMSDAPYIVSHRVALSSNSNVWCSRYCISSCCSLLQQQCVMLQILYLIVLLSPTTAMSDAPDIVSHRVALSSNSNVWCSRYCISSCCSLLQQQCLMLQILYLIVLLSPTTAMSDAPDIVSHRVALSSNSNVWCSRYCISSCCSLLQQQCLMLQILYLIVLLSPTTAMSDAPDIVSHRVALSYNSNVWCSRYCISPCCSLLQQQCLMLQILYLIVLLSPTTAMSDAPDIVSHRVALSSNSNVWCSRYCISSCCSLLQQQCLMLHILYLTVLLSPPTAMSDAPDIVSHRVALSYNSNAWCSRYCISSCCSLLQQQCLMLQILYLIVLLSPTTAMSDAPDIVSHRVALSSNSNVWCSRYCISSCCSLLQQQCVMLQILYLTVLLSPTTAMSDAPDIVSHRVALSYNSNVWCSRYCISSCCSLLQQQCLMLQILYLIVLLSPPTAMRDAPDIVSHRVALSSNSNVWCSRYCISSCCSLLQQQCLMLQILYLIVLLSPPTAMSDAPDIVSHRVALSYNSNVWCSRYCISSCCSLLQQQCLMLQILYLTTTAMYDAPDIVSHRVALSYNSNVWCSRYCISSCCSLLQQQCLMLQILYLTVLLSPTTAMSDAPDIVSHRVALSSNSNVWCSRYCISSCCSLLQQQCLMLQILYLIVLLSPTTAMSDAPDIVSHCVALSYNSNVWCSRYCISSCCSLLQQQCLMLHILYLIVLLSPTTAMSDAPYIVSHRVALSSNSNVWCSRYCISSCCSLLQQQCLMLQILYLIVLLSPTTAMRDAPDIVSHRVALSYNSNVWCSRYCISSCCSLLQQQCLMLQILYLIVLLSPPTAMSDAPDIVSHRVALSSNSNVWCSRYCISSCCSLLQQQCLMLQILYLTVLLSPPTAMSDAPDIVSHRVALSYNSNVWCSRYCISSCCSLLQQQCLMLQILYLIVLLSPTTAMSDAPYIVSHRVALSYNSNAWCSRYCISSCCSLLQQQCLMLQILYLIVLLSPTTAMSDAPDIVSHRVALSSNSNVWCSIYCISSCCSLLQQQCLMLQILYLIVLLSPPTAMSDAPDIVSHRVALSYNSNVWCSRYCISSCCSLLQQQCLMLQILYLIVLLSPTTAMSDAPDIVSHRVALSYNSNVWCSRYCISSCCSLLQQQCLMLQILYLIVLLSPTTAMRDAPDIVSHRVALSYNSNVWCSRYCISSCCSLLQQQCLMLQILNLIVLLSQFTT